MRGKAWTTKAMIATMYKTPASTGKLRIIAGLPSPVDQVRGRLLGHALPPDIAVVGQRHVGEDSIAAAGGHGVGI
jgi:hypothetical protein